MTKLFSTIGIIGKYSDPGVADTIRVLGRFLHEKDRRVLLDETTARMINGRDWSSASREEIGASCDLAVIVGGDGTMLNAARSLSDHDIPILGINLGRLGFLADISPDTMLETLQSILAGEYLEERRSLLHAKFICEGGLTTESDAFNEVVIHKWNVARMIELDTLINGEYVNTQRSDGLIVATPTGSTAYALSGGGPLLHPSLNAVVLVPICPHTMSHRPLVVDDDNEIEIVVRKDNPVDAQVTCDGQINFNLVPGDRVIIRKKDQPVRLIHPANYDYFDILRAKLHWGKKL